MPHRFGRQYRDYAESFYEAADRAYRHGVRGGIAGGLLGAAAGVGTGLAVKHPPQPGDSKKSEAKKTARNAAVFGLLGAEGGGYTGFRLGHAYGENHAQQDRQLGKTFTDRMRERLEAGSPAKMEAHLEEFGLSGNEKKKAEVLQRIRAGVAKAHPDRGGSSQKFIKTRASEAALKASKWFKKLAGLPAVVTQQAKAKRNYSWKPSLLETAKEYLRLEPELKSAQKGVIGQGAAAGAMAGGMAGGLREMLISRQKKDKKLTEEEASKLRRSHGLLASVAKGALVSAGVSGGVFRAMARKSPFGSQYAGIGAGMLAALPTQSLLGPRRHWRSKEDEKFIKNLDSGMQRDLRRAGKA